MVRRFALLAAVLLLVFVCRGVRADVVVSTSLSLTSLTITPDSGTTLQIISPLSFSGFASAEDSTTPGISYDLLPPDDPATAATALANASASAPGPALANGSDGVTISGMLNASADTDANVEASETFEIEASESAPVSVTFGAALSYSQSLTTDAYASFGDSEVTFSLFDPNFSNPSPNDISGSILFLDNLLVTGPSGSITETNSVSTGPDLPSDGSSGNIVTSASPAFTLNGTEILMTNTQYTLFGELDAESSGYNTPEPGYYLLLAAGLSLLFICARRGRRS